MIPAGIGRASATDGTGHVGRTGHVRRGRAEKATHRTAGPDRESPLSDASGRGLARERRFSSLLRVTADPQPSAKRHPGMAAVTRGHLARYNAEIKSRTRIQAMVAHFLSADWSKNANKRAVYAADVRERRCLRLDPPDCGWTVRSLLNTADKLAHDGPVLIGVDVALGLPYGYWIEARRLGGSASANFVEWLGAIARLPDFFDESTSAETWRPERPWFRVPAGKGGRSDFEEKVRGGMLRKVERATAGKPMFALSGIPGTVGSGTREFWRELGPLLSSGRGFSIWPFEGESNPPGVADGVALCEMFPRLAYAMTLDCELPTTAVAWSKTRSEERHKRCDSLGSAHWVCKHTVDLCNVDHAKENEDDFDALFTAAGVLRCLLEDQPLVDEKWVDRVVEGSILLAGPVHPSVGQLSRSVNPRVHSVVSYPCPIAECGKVFQGSRAGWDKHIESPDGHPSWRPDIVDAAERRRLFRKDFSHWFAQG